MTEKPKEIIRRSENQKPQPWTPGHFVYSLELNIHLHFDRYHFGMEKDIKLCKLLWSQNNLECCDLHKVFNLFVLVYT